MNTNEYVYPKKDKKSRGEILYDGMVENSKILPMTEKQAQNFVKNSVGSMLRYSAEYLALFPLDNRDKTAYLEILHNKKKEERDLQEGKAVVKFEIKNALPTQDFTDWYGNGRPGNIRQFPLNVFTGTGEGLPSNLIDKRENFWAKAFKIAEKYTTTEGFFNFMFKKVDKPTIYENMRTFKWKAPHLKSKAWGTPNKYLTMSQSTYETSAENTVIGISVPLMYKEYASKKFEVGNNTARQVFLCDRAFKLWKLCIALNQMHNMEDPYYRRLKTRKYAKVDENVYQFEMRTRDKFFGIMQKNLKDPLDKVINDTITLLKAADDSGEWVESTKWGVGVPDDLLFDEVYKDENRDYDKAGPSSRGFRNEASAFNRQKEIYTVNGHSVFKLAPVNHEEYADGFRVTTSRTIMWKTNYFPIGKDAIHVDGSYNTNNMNIRVFDEVTAGMNLVHFGDLLKKVSTSTEHTTAFKNIWGAYDSNGEWKLHSIVQKSIGIDKADDFWDYFYKALVCSAVKYLPERKPDMKDLYTYFINNFTAVGEKVNKIIEGKWKSITGIDIPQNLQMYVYYTNDQDVEVLGSTPDGADEFKTNWTNLFKSAKVTADSLLTKFTENNAPLPFGALLLRFGIYECDDLIVAHKDCGVVYSHPTIGTETLDPTGLSISIDLSGGVLFKWNNTDSGFRKIPNANIRSIKKKCDKDGILIITKLSDTPTIQGKGNPLPLLTGKYHVNYKDYIDTRKVECSKYCVSTLEHYKSILAKWIKPSPRLKSLHYESNVIRVCPRSYLVQQDMFDRQSGNLTKHVASTGPFAGIEYGPLLKNK